MLPLWRCPCGPARAAGSVTLELRDECVRAAERFLSAEPLAREPAAAAVAAVARGGGRCCPQIRARRFTNTTKNVPDVKKTLCPHEERLKVSDIYINICIGLL